MSGIVIREVKFRSAHNRPAVMPSVLCPTVKRWNADEMSTEWMCINRCLSCAYWQRFGVVNTETLDGTVFCSAPEAE